MARKNVLPYKLATLQSLSSNFTTPPTNITYTDNISYQINVTTTNSTGTFAVEVSDDYQRDATTNALINPGHWVALSLSGTPTVAGANDTIDIALQQVPYGAIRLSYSSIVAGTGTCDIYFLSKQIGG